MILQWMEIAEKVCKTAKRMHDHGLAALSSGNVSARISDYGLAAITPSGIPYEVITPEDIVIIDLEGNKVDGIHKPSSEAPVHLLILREREDVNAIVHTHSPYAITFSTLRESIPLICTEGLCVRTTRVEVTRYELPGTIELGRAVLEELERQPSPRAVLLANHGLLAIGESLEGAFRVAVNVEIEARIYHLARSLGKPHELTPDQMKAILNDYAS